MEIITLPNFLSFLRIPLAFIFLQEDPFLRALAIIAAMITDGLDGLLARRYNMGSKFGVFLDPFTDKFFVIFAITTFIQEGLLTLPQATALLCRDFSVVLFGIYLTFSKQLYHYNFRSIVCGKASTFLQFLVLFGLATRLYIAPGYFYSIFVLLGLLALVELYLPKAKTI